MAWALIKHGKVVAVQDNPTPVQNVKRRDMFRYRWMSIPEGVTVNQGDEYFGNKFETPEPAATNTFLDSEYYYQYAKRNDHKNIFKNNGGMSDYITLTTEDLSDGTYKLSWKYHLSLKPTTKDYIADVTLTDDQSNSTLIARHAESMSINNSFGNKNSEEPTQRLVVSDFDIIQLSGINELKLEFGSSQSKMLTVLKAIVDIQRVG